MIRIRSKRDGFRRCDMRHLAEAVEYQDDKFSEEQLEILQGESMLIVEVVEDSEQAKPSTNQQVVKAPAEITGFSAKITAKPETPVTGSMTIIEAIGELEVGNKRHWTKDKKPQVFALEQILKRQISASDRDAAHKIWLKKATD